MQKQILVELKELRIIISRLIGTADLPKEEQFSPAAIEKAAKEFKKLAILRGEWLPESDLSRIFRGAYFHAGKFIRTEFGFSNYFKQGKSYFYNKSDLLKLAKELKERNVTLYRYMELKQSQENFKKNLAAAAANKKATKKRISYHLPDDLKDVETSNPPVPDVNLIKEDITRLKEEFFNGGLDKYIDIYRGSYAMVKNDYAFMRYRDKTLGQRIRKWCDSFNYANHALEAATNKRAEFIPVRDDDMIQL